eukprot:c1143_g1_i1.p1 GENE.c1143_g1_i1~~c1143_g1_i1.p1  ORF type:complete len:278 (-),score=73.44 c1143_g1_i1:283-1116(-)
MLGFPACSSGSASEHTSTPHKLEHAEGHRHNVTNLAGVPILAISPCTPTIHFRKLTQNLPIDCTTTTATASTSAELTPWPLSASLDRDWSSSSLGDSPSVSSLAPSPNTRIRSITHAHRLACSRSTHHLSGEAFALVSSIFDALSVSTHEHIDPEDDLDSCDEFMDMDGICHRTKIRADLYVVPLAKLRNLLQKVVTKQLSLESQQADRDDGSVLDELFLSCVLCEVYKLESDVFFRELVACVTTAIEAASQSIAQSTPTHAHWTCNRVLELVLASL